MVKIYSHIYSPDGAIFIQSKTQLVANNVSPDWQNIDSLLSFFECVLVCLVMCVLTSAEIRRVWSAYSDGICISQICDLNLIWIKHICVVVVFFTQQMTCFLLSIPSRYECLGLQNLIFNEQEMSGFKKKISALADTFFCLDDVSEAGLLFCLISSSFVYASLCLTVPSNMFYRPIGYRLSNIKKYRFWTIFISVHP